MKQEYLNKDYSSASIEELLSYSGKHEDRSSWLLSYLDVFVLVVMLVITLMSLGNFDQPPSSHKAQPLALTDNKRQSQPIGSDKAKKALVNNLQESKKPPKSQHLSSVTEKEKPVASNTQAKKMEAIPIEPVIDVESMETSHSFPMSPVYPGKSVYPVPGVIERALWTDNMPKDNQRAEDPKALATFENSERSDSWQQQTEQLLNDLQLPDAIKINVQQGYAQIEIQENILFQSAEAEITFQGTEVLERLIPALIQTAGLIYIEGHTDNKPINTLKFPSNWELGSARATNVLHFLAQHGLIQKHLRAVTYADTLPIADNDTETGRSKNRRVNILIKMPDETAVNTLY